MEENDNNKSLFAIASGLMLEVVPSYANKIYYSLGFLSMTSFIMLLISGLVLVAGGPIWWLTNPFGVFFRSMHLWSVQAFIFFVILHLLIVFTTAAYRPPRQLTWIIGILMFVLAITTAEFGYLLRGDLSSQIKAMHGSEFYGQIGVWFINNLNYTQVYGLHIAVLPLLIMGFLGLHYFLVKAKGIALPFNPNIRVTQVKANHNKLFMRGLAVVVVILVLSVLFPSPYIKPLTIKDLASESGTLAAKTILGELDNSSGTAKELAEKYHFDTADVFVFNPFGQYADSKHQFAIGSFKNAPKPLQQIYIKDAYDYFDKSGEGDLNSANPVIVMTSDLVMMAKTGLYESALRAQLKNGFDTTYSYRFLIDSGTVDEAADNAGIGEETHGLLKEENSRFLPPGSWWLAPMDLMQSYLLKNDPTVHRTESEVFAVLFLLAVAFPFIPWLNRLPEKLPFAKLIWKEHQTA